MDETFNIFDVKGLGMTKKDSIIAFKYLEKLTEKPNVSKLVKEAKTMKKDYDAKDFLLNRLKRLKEREERLEAEEEKS